MELPSVLAEEVFASLLELYENDPDLKSHQKAAHVAFKASVAADDAMEKHAKGEADPKAVSDLHVAAHNHHVTAAKELMRSGQHTTAQHHMHIAKKHEKHAIHFGSIEPKKKAVGEGQTPWGTSMTEQRNLMGYEPVLRGPATRLVETKRKGNFGDVLEQRRLMGMDNQYPTLAEARGARRAEPVVEDEIEVSEEEAEIEDVPAVEENDDEGFDALRSFQPPQPVQESAQENNQALAFLRTGKGMMRGSRT